MTSSILESLGAKVTWHVKLQFRKDNPNVEKNKGMQAILCNKPLSPWGELKVRSFFFKIQKYEIIAYVGYQLLVTVLAWFLGKEIK